MVVKIFVSVCLGIDLYFHIVVIPVLFPIKMVFFALYLQQELCKCFLFSSDTIL